MIPVWERETVAAGRAPLSFKKAVGKKFPNLMELVAGSPVSAAGPFTRYHAPTRMGGLPPRGPQG